MRRNKLINLNFPLAELVNITLSKELDELDRWLRFEISIRGIRDVSRYCSERLYKSVVRKPLFEAGKQPPAHRWVCEPTSVLLNHISQSCYWAHQRRIVCYDNFVKYVHNNLVQSGDDTYLEPYIPVGESSFLKPDMVAVKTKHIMVIDAQVVSDSGQLDVAHDDKALI